MPQKKGSIKLLMSASQKGKTTGEKHYNWKGENANYRNIHEWITNKLGKPLTCQHCKRTAINTHGIHWANISGKYKRNDLSNWIRLCVKCHKKYDKTNKFKLLAKRNVNAKTQ